MKLIIGLGNPGKKYERTRHNVGFVVIDKLISDFGFRISDWKESKKARALYCKTEINGVSVEFLKPQTFMNESGVSVAYAAKKHNLKPSDIIVIHDDKDIPLGEYKIQTNRGPAGHNGVISIINHLRTQNFTRVRIGIKPAKEIDDTADFVLKKFTKDEQKIMKEVIDKVIADIKKILS